MIGAAMMAPWYSGGSAMIENKYIQYLDDLKWFVKAKEHDIKVGTPAFNLLIEFYKQATQAHRLDNPESVRGLFIYSETVFGASRIRVFKPEIQKGNLLEWTGEFAAIADRYIKNQLPETPPEAAVAAVGMAPPLNIEAPAIKGEEAK